jgi:predicted nucleic acid-binding protein
LGERLEGDAAQPLHQRIILVDSSVWIDYFNGRATGETDLLDRLLSAQRLLLGDLILVEVLQGFRSDLDFHRARRVLGMLQCVTIGGPDTAIAAAQNFRALRRRGVTARKTIDVLIATFCIIKGHELLHCDRDFEAFERYLGLRVLKG